MIRARSTVRSQKCDAELAASVKMFGGEGLHIVSVQAGTGLFGSWLGPLSVLPRDLTDIGVVRDTNPLSNACNCACMEAIRIFRSHILVDTFRDLSTG